MLLTDGATIANSSARPLHRGQIETKAQAHPQQIRRNVSSSGHAHTHDSNCWHRPAEELVHGRFTAQFRTMISSGHWRDPTTLPFRLISFFLLLLMSFILSRPNSLRRRISAHCCQFLPLLRRHYQLLEHQKRPMKMLRMPCEIFQGESIGHPQTSAQVRAPSKQTATRKASARETRRPKIATR